MLGLFDTSRFVQINSKVFEEFNFNCQKNVAIENGKNLDGIPHGFLTLGNFFGFIKGSYEN